MATEPVTQASLMKRNTEGSVELRDRPGISISQAHVPPPTTTAVALREPSVCLKTVPSERSRTATAPPNGALCLSENTAV